MFCMSCGAKIDDQATFCGNCGARTAAAGTPATTPPPPPPTAPVYAAPAYAAPVYAPPPPPPPPPPKKKRHGCLIAFLVFLCILAVAVVGVIGWINGWFVAPRYSTADFTSAMDKIGLTIDFEGMTPTQLADFVKAHKGEKFSLADYDITFSDYQEKSFSLTEREANAFCNLVAPNFSWFDKVDFRINKDGSVTGNYKVDFKKVKAELIPDLLGDIPPQISGLLPNSFTLKTEGTARIVENQVLLDEPLKTLNIGPIPLQPIIENINGGPLDGGARQGILDVTARIFTIVPDLTIHDLEVQNGEFVFSGYVPTHVTVTPKS